tara:strand:- start:129 stop:815 length:687 start_codon:yes stop_codon:yes gene_type:complete
MLRPPFPTKFNPFSDRFRQTLNEIGESSSDWEQRAEDIERRLSAIERRPPIHNCFPAVLNTAALLGNSGGTQKRWKYAWEEYLPGVALSKKGFPGQGPSATSTRSSWVPVQGQRSSWGNDGSTAYSASADPYGFYAINLAEIENDSVAAGAAGYVSYGQKVGAGPSGSGTISLLSVGNVASSTESDNRRVVVWMWELLRPTADTIDPDNTKGIMYAFSAGNEVEVSCS